MVHLSFNSVPASSVSIHIAPGRANHQNLLNAESFFKHFTQRLITGQGLFDFSTLRKLSLVNRQMNSICKKIEYALINSNVSPQNLLHLFPQKATATEMIRYAVSEGFVPLIQALAIADPLRNYKHLFKTELSTNIQDVVRLSLDQMVEDSFSHQKNVPILNALIQIHHGIPKVNFTYLMRSVLRKDVMGIEILQNLLKAEENINYSFYSSSSKYHDFTALMIAADVKNLEAVEILSAARANLNAYDSNGNTALMLAVQNNELSTIKKLIELGADLSVLNKKGETALMAAYRNDTLQALLKMTPLSSPLLEVENFKGETALKLAINNYFFICQREYPEGNAVKKQDQKERLAMIKSLLQAGASVSVLRYDVRAKALALACIEELIQANASTGTPSFWSRLAPKNWFKR